MTTEDGSGRKAAGDRLGHFKVENVFRVIFVDEHVGSIENLIWEKNIFESLETSRLRIVSLSLLQSRMEIEPRLPDLSQLS